MALFKVALLGTGTAAKEHAKGWLLAGAKVVATAGPQTPSSELRRLIPDVPHSPELAESLASGIDAVDICTPHHLHLQQMLEMLDWPVSILVEKPLVTTARDLKSLRLILGERRYPVVMRTNKRFEKRIIQFLDLVRNAPRPLSGRITWDQRPEYMAARQWYRDRSISGGGVVLGMGIHYLDLLAELSTDAVIQNATIHTYRCSPNAPDTTSENYAKVNISVPQIQTELILSAWKRKPLLPNERIRVVNFGRSSWFERQRVRDVEAELSAEFQHYRDVISRGDFHPRKEVVLKAHELALEIYQRTR